MAGLPAHVFVRGFIRSYAKAVGIADAKPLSLFDRAIGAKTEAERVEAQVPVVDPALAGGAVVPDDDETGRRRGLGLAVFVIILVLIATLTLSLLLRRPPQSGEGLSLGQPEGQTSGATVALDGTPKPDRV